MRRALTLFALLAIAAAAIAGCGGGGGGSSSGDGSSAPAPASTTSGGSGSASGGGAAIAVTMKNIAFSPKSATVKVGQKVTWTNADTVAHNVMATSGASFRSSDFGQGGAFSYTPTKAGTIEYVCTLHPGMSGTLVVTR